MNESQKERLTVDLLPDQKKKLRIITAMLGEKYMQNTVIRLIEEKFEVMNITSFPAKKPKTSMPNFADEEMRNLQA